MINTMAAQIDAMAAVFEQQLALVARKSAPTPPLQPTRVLYEGVVPPVRGQREMLFLLAKDAQAGLAYTECLAFALEGAVDAGALEQAWRFLAHRHDALRVASMADDGIRVSSAMPPWAVVDGADGLLDDQALLRTELATAIDPAHGPLARAVLHRGRQDRHVLVIVVHHLVADGWSLGLLLAELAVVYNASRLGTTPSLPPARSFKDFAEWLPRQPAQIPATPHARDTPCLILPGDGDGPDRKGFQGFRLHRRNPRLPGQGEGTAEGLFARVRRCGRTLGMSPVVVLLGSFVVFLGRLSGQRRLRIGLPFAGHSVAEMPVMVGMASAVMPLEVDLGGAAADPPTFHRVLHAVSEALAQARSTAAGLFAEGSGSAPPVSVLFNIDPGVRLDFDGLRLTSLSLPLAHVKAELFLNLLELNGEVLLDFDCHAGLASPERAGLWLDGWMHLLAHALDQPDTPIAALALGPLTARVAPGLRLLDGLGGNAAIGATARLWRQGPAAELDDTGSMARVEADGRVQVLGAADRHLRLANGWVNLDAVEQALQSHPSVRQAAALVEAEGLTAFVVPHAVRGVVPGVLDDHVRRLLAEHACPAAYVELSTLPLDRDGRPDAAVLRADASTRQPAQTKIAPRNALETRLAGLWAELLSLSTPPGVTDDFFVLGGHSLKAVALVNRIAREFGKNVPVGAFFRSPTIAALADLLATAHEMAPIPRRTPAAWSAPSHAQSRLWLLEQLHPGQQAYNMGFVLRRPRPLSPSVLVAALGRLAARHESLRSTLVARDAAPWMRVAHVLVPALPVHDLRGLADAQTRMDAMAQQVVGAPFDLETPPLWRCALLRLDTGDALVVGLHHAIGDNWSIAVWVRDFLALLQQEETGVGVGAGVGAPALPALDVQYGDYAVWHNARVEADAASLAYWSDRLADAPAVLQLPTCRPRQAWSVPTATRDAGSHCTHPLSSRTVAAMQTLCATRGITGFMVMVAAWRLWLWARTGQRDAVIGTLHAGRDHPVLADQIGFFVNTLPLRDTLTPEASFLDLLDQTRQTVLGAFEHAETPFNVLAERLPLPRSVGGNPLFEVMLTMDDWQDIDTWVDQAGCQVHEVELPVSQFELTLSAVERPQGLELRMQYRTALWDAAIIEGWLREVDVLLGAACTDPGQCLSMLARPADLVVPDASIGVVAGFEVWRRRQPQAPAVLGPSGLSYEALGVAVDDLARRLVQDGVGAGSDVGRDEVVAVLVERSWHLPAATLGVMKAGAAVLLLDATYPDERLSFLLRDARCTRLVTDAEHATRAGQWVLEGTLSLLRLDAPESTALVTLPTCQPTDLAYIVYTSGSTGQPKGVMVEQGALADHLAGMTPVVGIAAGDRSLVFASAGVDAVIEQMLLPLLNGAALHVADQERYSPEALVQRWRDLDLNILDLPPVFWGGLIALGQQDADRVRGLALKTLLVGGEDMTPARVAGWYALPLYCARLVNAYGPTEATITPTAAWVAPQAAGQARIPIGQPVGRRRARVVQSDGSEASAGDAGELWLGGASLARGYLHQPALSDQKFVTEADGQRWYRTGDLARWRPDGQLECLGRIDRQIKLRGFRIEPDEIEDALRHCFDVVDAAVTLEQAPEGEFLLGWLVATPEAVLTRAEVVAQLAHRLPAHMVPARYRRIDHLPVTPGGKLDRAALHAQPVVELANDAGSPPMVMSPTVQALCMLLGEVLQVAEVRPRDNFFALGGHSLQAVQVLARVRERLGVELSLRDIFASATIEDLAAIADAATPITAATRTTIPVVSRTQALPASAGQRRLWLLQTRQPDLVAFNMVAGLRITGTLEVPALAAACRAVVWRHEVLRTRLVMRAGRLVQDILPGEGGFALQCESTDTERQEDDVLAEELNRPFLLESEMPLRMRLLRLGETGATDRHLLVVNVHHVAFDGWSANVMFSDLAALYTAARAGGMAGGSADLVRRSGLPTLALQYADHAHWQGQSMALARHHHWLSQFDVEDLPVLALPCDRPRPERLSGQGRMVVQSFGATVSQRLHALALQEGVTLFAVMAALTMAQLHGLSGQRDLILGTAVAGRGDHRLENQIGFYVNMLPLRIRIDPSASVRTLVRQMGGVACEALQHQNVPFDELVEALAPPRLPGRQPLFDVVLILQNLAPMHLDLVGTQTHLIQDRSVSAKYDLMYMVEGDDVLDLHLEYALDLFDESTVSNMARAMVELAEAAVQAPDQALSELLTRPEPPSLPAAEQAGASLLADDEW